MARYLWFCPPASRPGLPAVGYPVKRYWTLRDCKVEKGDSSGQQQSHITSFIPSIPALSFFFASATPPSRAGPLITTPSLGKLVGATGVVVFKQVGSTRPLTGSFHQPNCPPHFFASLHPPAPPFNFPFSTLLLAQFPFSALFPCISGFLFVTQEIKVEIRDRPHTHRHFQGLLLSCPCDSLLPNTERHHTVHYTAKGETRYEKGPTGRIGLTSCRDE